MDAWPRFAEGLAPKDNDHIGMPDLWEQAHNLNPAALADGYTNIEAYLNGIVSGQPIWLAP